MERIERYFDTAIESPDGIKKLRGLILTLAMQGKLVPQDPKDQPASELLKEIAAEKKRLEDEGKIKKQKELPPIKPEEVPYALPVGWEWVRLDSICSTITQGPNPKYSGKSDKAYRVLKTKDFYDDRILYNQFELISYDIFQEYKRYQLKTNDLIFGLVGKGSTAKCNIFLEQKDFNCIFTRATGLIRLIDTFKTLPAYVHLFFLSGHGKNRTEIITDGSTGQLVIRTSELKMIEFPLPPLPEQQRIVEKIDHLMALCDSLEEQIAMATHTRTAIFDAVLAKVQGGGRELN